MNGLTTLGEPLVVVTAGFVGFIVSLQRHQSDISHVFVYALAAFCINTVLKLMMHRNRPHGLIIKNLGVKSYSFPSGHAFGTLIFYGQFAILDMRYLTHPVNIIIASLLWAIIFLIGLSRVYLGAHYPSDVMGGWLLGGISLAIINLAAF